MSDMFVREFDDCVEIHTNDAAIVTVFANGRIDVQPFGELVETIRWSND